MYITKENISSIAKSVKLAAQQHGKRIKHGQILDAIAAGLGQTNFNVLSSMLNSESSNRSQTNPSAYINLNSTGIYLAYPTTDVLKPTYRGHKTLVNNRHSKVGITVKSFLSRKKEYYNTFGGEIEFIPLVEMTPELLKIVEGVYNEKIREKYSQVGSTREWYETDNREDLAKIVLEVVNQLPTGYKSIQSDKVKEVESNMGIMPEIISYTKPEEELGRAMNFEAYADLFRELEFLVIERGKKLHHSKPVPTIYFNKKRDGLVYFTVYKRDEDKFHKELWSFIRPLQKKDNKPNLLTLIPKSGKEKEAFRSLF